MLRKLGSEGLSEGEIRIISGIVGNYLRQPDVAAALLDVAVVGQQPDLGMLSAGWQRFGGQQKLQNIRFDFDRSLLTLLASITDAVLSHASQPQSALTNLVLVNRVVANQRALRQTERLVREPPQPETLAYHSCFISYATADLGFVETLYDDLIQAGVVCWFAPQDLKIGDKLLQTIYQAISGYDKLLVVLSEHSVDSQWVEDEMEMTFDRERINGEFILFPIRLDETVLQTIDYAWVAKVRQRFIGDFSQPTSYQQSLERLLRDLQRM